MSDGRLPETWIKVSLEEITEPIVKVLPAKDPKKEIRYLDISGIDNRSNRVIEAKTYTGADAPSRARQLVREGDVLFSTVRTYLKNIARVPSEYDGQIASTGFSVLRPSKAILSEYLFAYTLTPMLLETLAALQRGSSYPAVREQDVRTQTIPLPPLAEQKRIVAKIEELFSELDAGEESLRRARRQLGVYRQALLKQAFEGKLTAPWRAQHPDLLESPDQLLARIQAERQARYQQQLNEWEKATKGWEDVGKTGDKPKKPRKPKDPIEIEGEILAELPSLPADWAWVSLGELADTTVGFAFKSKEFRQSGIRLLRGDNIEPRALRWANAMHWNEDDLDDYTDLLVNEGDIILAMDRPVISSGLKVALARSNDVPCLLVQRVARITGVEGIENRFLLALIDQQRFINHCLGHQTGTQLPHISEGQIRAYAVPLCSLPEQQEIVRLLDGQFEVIEQNEREIDAALKRSEALRQSILKKAFTGHLVPQHPTDEPATALLERIRKERENASKAPAQPRKRPSGAGRRRAR